MSSVEGGLAPLTPRLWVSGGNGVFPEGSLLPQRETRSARVWAMHIESFSLQIILNLSDYVTPFPQESCKRLGAGVKRCWECLAGGVSFM